MQGPREVAELCTRALLQIKWAGGEITSALDVGAGPGLWRDWFARSRPTIEVPIDRRQRLRVRALRPRATRHHHLARARKFDLVICQGVLPYLTSPGVVAAIENLAAMARGFLYLEAVTARDLDELCDRRRRPTAR